MRTFLSRVRATNLSQPDEVTCQAACIAMVCNLPKEHIPIIRGELLRIGVAGRPSVMAQVLRQRLGNRYELDLDASLRDCQQWIRAGEILITHGWFTNSGHVIVLDGMTEDTTNMSYRFSVKDSWAEFDFPNWRYLPGAKFFDGYYSSRGIYAACVASSNRSHAHSIYRRGELNSSQGGMWVHRIKP